MNTRLETPKLRGPAGTLEAVLHGREGVEPEATAVVCHPHPSYGGTLHNKVTHRVASTLHDLGVVVLRFNFSGAGGSEGRYDHGVGELEDARAALDWMAARHPRSRRWLAGFSFGSWIAARLAAERSEVEQLLLVAPPVRRMSFEALLDARVPKLVVQGTDDEVCPLAELQEQFPAWAEPKRLVVVPGATHFFDRRLSELGRTIAAALGPLLGGPHP